VKIAARPFWRRGEYDQRSTINEQRITGTFSIHQYWSVGSVTRGDRPGAHGMNFLRGLTWIRITGGGQRTASNEQRATNNEQRGIQ